MVIGKELTLISSLLKLHSDRQGASFNKLNCMVIGKELALISSLLKLHGDRQGVNFNKLIT